MAKSPTAAARSTPNLPATTAPSHLALTDEVPEFMSGDAGKGLESVGAEDVSVPRIKLMQGTSPELTTFDDLRQGDFWHTANEVNLGQKFLAVPVYRDKRYILWRPQDSGGGILARADDGKTWIPANTSFEVKLDAKQGGKTVTWTTGDTVENSGLALWGTSDPEDSSSPPAATLMYNFVLVFPEHPELAPAILTFQRSTVGVARKFLGTLKTRNRPIFGQVYEFCSVGATNKDGKPFRSIVPRAAGLIADKALYDRYKGMYETFAKSALQIRDVESLQVEAEEETATVGRPEY
jgi:hypothetical protein